MVYGGKRTGSGRKKPTVKKGEEIKAFFKPREVNKIIYANNIIYF